MEITVLGTGCAKCEKTYDVVEKVIKENNIDASLRKEQNILEIVKYDIIGLPAIVIDGVVKLKGYVPSEKEIKELFNIQQSIEMKKIIIYDPALCCPTGLCGVNIDPELMRIAVVVETLKRKGIIVERYNLRDNPQMYVDNKTINDFLMKEGAEKLPVTTVDGEIAVKGTYPANKQIAEWLNVSEKELTIKK